MAMGGLITMQTSIMMVYQIMWMEAVCRCSWVHGLALGALDTDGDSIAIIWI